jgi:hypothetical protein
MLLLVRTLRLVLEDVRHAAQQQAEERRKEGVPLLAPARFWVPVVPFIAALTHRIVSSSHHRQHCVSVAPRVHMQLAG